MEQFLIVTLLKGKGKSIQEALIKDVSERFGVHEYSDTKIPAHITLKQPFSTNDISYMVDFLEDFCSSVRSFSYECEGIGHFGEEVVYIDVVDQDGPLREVYDELQSEIKAMKKIEMGPFDGIGHFHASIAFRDIAEQFEEILRYVTSKEISFTQEFDNITLLKKKNGVWKIYLEIKIKKK